MNKLKFIVVVKIIIFCSCVIFIDHLIIWLVQPSSTRGIADPVTGSSLDSEHFGDSEGT